LVSLLPCSYIHIHLGTILPIYYINRVVLNGPTWAIVLSLSLIMYMMSLRILSPGTPASLGAGSSLVHTSQMSHAASSGGDADSPASHASSPVGLCAGHGPCSQPSPGQWTMDMNMYACGPSHACTVHASIKLTPSCCEYPHT
jgi:hypothetical protein